MLLQPLPFVKLCRGEIIGRLCPKPSLKVIEQLVCRSERLVRHQERLVILGIWEERVSEHIGNAKGEN